MAHVLPLRVLKDVCMSLGTWTQHSGGRALIQSVPSFVAEEKIGVREGKRLLEVENLAVELNPWLLNLE